LYVERPQVYSYSTEPCLLMYLVEDLKTQVQRKCCLVSSFVK